MGLFIHNLILRLVVGHMKIIKKHIIKISQSRDNDVGAAGEVEHEERAALDSQNTEFSAIDETWQLTSDVQSVGFAEIQTRPNFAFYLHRESSPLKTLNA